MALVRPTPGTSTKDHVERRLQLGADVVSTGVGALSLGMLDLRGDVACANVAFAERELAVDLGQSRHSGNYFMEFHQWRIANCLKNVFTIIHNDSLLNG